MPLENSSKVVLYLSSAMTGIADFNYPVFHAMEQSLKVTHPKVKLLNPARNFNGSKTKSRKEHMRKDFEMLLTATAIMFFGNWQDSKGVQAEFTIAKELELDMYNAYGNKIYPEEVSFEKDVSNPKPQEKEAPKDILDQAREIVLGDRKRDYNSPYQNFCKIASLWSALGFQWQGGPIPMERVADALVLLKLARGAHAYKFDSELDSIGYIFCKQLALKEQSEHSIPIPNQNFFTEFEK